jgi:dipeptidyl aminopeptidase/acylaminoacyl peptidase
VVAYTREELDPALDPINTKRAWVVPLDTRESRLLLDDPGAKASAPEWSPVGERVAVVLGEPPGILVYDFPTDQGVFIQTAQGVAGIFSPDGKRFIYPKLAFGAAGATYYTHLGMVDLEAVGEQREVELSGGAESPVDDLQAAFHPDGTHLAIVRRYLDNRYTEGGQVYWLDATTLEATPLVVDPAHTHGAISFSQDGRLLLMQRYNLTARRDPPEIWLYVLPTHEMRQVVVDGFLPKFLP